MAEQTIRLYYPGGEHIDVPKDRVYVTGTNQVMYPVHEQNEDCAIGCVIHNPTDPHKDWPTHWRGDRGIMERICPCGVGHPDRDQLDYIERRWGRDRALCEAVHGCCGCCSSHLRK